jgi:dTDP-4-dehydrorhamnose reductase
MTDRRGAAGLELWGGMECTVNRVDDTFRDQLLLTGHDRRLDDLDRFAELGLRTLRFPVLWERTAPDRAAGADWRWPDAYLTRARDLGLRPIVGLVHHGSGPAGTSLLDPAFPDRLAEYARAVAERYPWITAYTPVNEPLTTARFSGMYGLWYPHRQGSRDFIEMVLNQCRASILAMRAIREVVPDARWIQTEDLGRTYSTPLLAYQADFDNDRRWLSLDLLTGRLGPEDRMWRYLRDQGVAESTIAWFGANGFAPDVIGVNHYVTSNRYLDPALHLYPEDSWGGNGRHQYADVAAVRVVDDPAGPAELLGEVWHRYGAPVAITEAHIGCTREEQLRWLLEVWRGAQRARDRGADVRAVTVWALLGAFDWDSLLVVPAGRYEPGVFDVRGPRPRPTALASLVRELAGEGTTTEPLAQMPGWWRRRVRFAHGPRRSGPTRPSFSGLGGPRLILVTGAGGTLGSAFGRIAALRGLDAMLLTRADLDIADPDSVEAAFATWRPWAVVNAAGYVRVPDAERERERCFRENADGARELAAACARHGARLVTFSTDLVFPGRERGEYVESDPVEPTTVYGASKAEAERRVAELLPSTLVIRTSAFFGPWDAFNLLTRGLEALERGEEFTAPAAVVSPTYVPDLVNAALDLLIDREQGVWHLANVGAVSWRELLARGAALVGVSAAKLRDAPTPITLQSTALGSERGLLLPPLDDALARYASRFRDQPARTRPDVSADPRPAAGA